VTGLVLPVLAYGEWQVEALILDLGDGWREWIEVRRGDAVEHCATRADLAALLHRHELRLTDFAELDTVQDGCE
jgi:hypothetical protein